MRYLRYALLGLLPQRYLAPALLLIGIIAAAVRGYTLLGGTGITVPWTGQQRLRFEGEEGF